MNFANISEKNYILYAAKCYESPLCLQSEFESDFKKIKYIKRLIHRYKITDELKERLVLNHIICLANVFGVECAVRLLFFKIDPKYYYILKTFLLFLDYMPDVVMGIDGKNINSFDIPVELKLAELLRRI